MAVNWSQAKKLEAGFWPWTSAFVYIAEDRMGMSAGSKLKGGMFAIWGVAGAGRRLISLWIVFFLASLNTCSEVLKLSPLMAPWGLSKFFTVSPGQKKYLVVPFIKLLDPNNLINSWHDFQQMALCFLWTALNTPRPVLLRVPWEGHRGTWAQFGSRGSKSPVNKVEWAAQSALVDGIWKQVKGTPLWSCLSLIIGTPESYLVLIKIPNHYPLCLITIVPQNRRATAGLSHIEHTGSQMLSDIASSTPDENLQNYKPSKFIHSIQPLTFSLSRNHSPIHIAFKRTMQIQPVSVSESHQKANTFFFQILKLCLGQPHLTHKHK